MVKPQVFGDGPYLSRPWPVVLRQDDDAYRMGFVTW